ncbi:MAG: DUF493 domain-containing protein [Planctomycetes bacterium]|nr:DUF493 domain-containing protein [Planctomycetota bacterium]
MQQRPEIDYPCPWTYVVVGMGEAVLTAHIELALAGAEYTKATSRHSRSGRYTSIEITLEVSDEEQRLVVFRALQNHPAVKLVI